jgi:hypothetical protein
VSDTTNDLEFYRQKFAEMQKQQDVCPSCGHCPTCGRGGHQVAPWVVPTPYYPTHPVHPWYPGPIWISSGTHTTC